MLDAVLLGQFVEPPLSTFCQHHVPAGNPPYLGCHLVGFVPGRLDAEHEIVVVGQRETPRHLARPVMLRHRTTSGTNRTPP
ncbi:hypothetical protein EV649_2270 [Kribbella sp. VKM Ac-2569]|uniref:hypothetical protein n=1 Tax=Kribbella sp. VKM Ac-2569 TaxID=2512220 RepID=UPI00102C990A|nr:hypothetical protein [Kribbella sp. VKM Ac-2569]RZT28493.1 hypothetical protein EV649_2270 [Kribbella sp. VKM Ac-2569]